jgi:hypothetical protein
MRNPDEGFFQEETLKEKLAPFIPASRSGTGARAKTMDNAKNELAASFDLRFKHRISPAKTLMISEKGILLVTALLCRNGYLQAKKYLSVFS